MVTKRRSFNAQFKFKVALEAVKGVKTLSELASEHGVHPNHPPRDVDRDRIQVTGLLDGLTSKAETAHVFEILPEAKTLRPLQAG